MVFSMVLLPGLGINSRLMPFEMLDADSEPPNIILVEINVPLLFFKKIEPLKSEK